jgi:catechol 2,3-dioxygenase-like lactoylglutathione lyase family enzyme
MAKPSKFAHVVYSTRRFEEMIEWYQRVFEAEVVYQNPVFAFLTYDDEHHRFAFANLSALMLLPGSRRQSNGISSGLRYGRRGQRLHAD